MNKSILIASALVLGSSSVAMADSSFSFGARAQVSWGTPSSRVIVRDHRTPTYQAPVYQGSYATDRYTTDRYTMDRYTTDRYPVNQRPILPAGLDCRNWDPSLDVSDACADFFSDGYATQQPRARYGWTLLGVRESSVADNQFVTVNDGRIFGTLQLRAETGNPIITKVAVRFMDNTTQVINVGGQLRNATLRLGHRAINQLVIYTAAGSHGTYSMSVQ